MLRVGQKVRRNDKYNKLPEFDHNKLKQATGRVTRVVYSGSCCKSCCFGFDWHYTAICKAEVWWDWPNGETMLADHTSGQLDVVRRKRKRS